MENRIIITTNCKMSERVDTRKEKGNSKLKQYELTTHGRTDVIVKSFSTGNSSEKKPRLPIKVDK